MTHTVKNRAILLIALFMSRIACAEIDLSASMSAGVTGRGSEVSLTATPALSALFDTRNLSIESSWFSTLDAENGWLDSGTWQSSNELNWTTTSNRVSGYAGYSHSETFSELSDVVDTTNILKAGTNFLVPQTQTLNHSFGLDGTYTASQLEETGTATDDVFGVFSYGMTLMASERQRFQALTSYTFYRSGAKVVTGQVTSGFNGARINHETTLSLSMTQLDENEIGLIGGRTNVSWQIGSARLIGGINRSQQDALSTFTVGFLDNQFEYQSQLVVTEGRIGLEQVPLFSSVTANIDYSLGNTRSLSSVADLNVSESFSREFQQVSFILNTQPVSQVLLSFSASHRVENSIQQTQVVLNYSQSLSSNWSWNTQISSVLQSDDYVNWSANLRYLF